MIPTFRPLFASCPAKGCGGNGPRSLWEHSGCGGRTEIDNKCNIRCSIHHSTSSSIVSWGFICSQHQNIAKKADLEALAHSFDIAGQMSVDNTERIWATQLMRAIARLVLDNTTDSGELL